MDLKPNASKKMKFVPKAPSRRPPKPVVPKTEALDYAESPDAKELMRRLNDGLAAGKLKNERKSAPVRVAFGSGGSKMADNYYDDYKSSSSRNKDGENPSGLKPYKEYEEPWDYESYYPVTLPLRKPYSGRPDLLDEEEFGTLLESFDESRMSTAVELGLVDEFSEPGLMLFQLPKTVPLPVPEVKGEGASSTTRPPTRAGLSERSGRSLRSLPEGLMGKLLVYNSGKVKLKLGDALYDVNPGSNCKFAEECVAINTEEKHCSHLGQIHKHAIVTPDVDSILDSVDSISDGLANADLG